MSAEPGAPSFPPIYRAARGVAQLAATIGLVLILATAVLTCTDVVIRNLGFRGIIGMVDLTQLFILAAASLVIPIAFFGQSHVTVDLVTQRLGPRTNAIIALMSMLLGAGLLVLLVIYGWQQAAMSVRAGDRSQTLQLPIALYWVLFLSGNAVSAGAAMLMAARHLRHAVSGRDALLEVDHRPAS